MPEGNSSEIDLSKKDLLSSETLESLKVAAECNLDPRYRDFLTNLFTKADSVFRLAIETYELGEFDERDHELLLITGSSSWSVKDSDQESITRTIYERDINTTFESKSMNRLVSIVPVKDYYHPHDENNLDGLVPHDYPQLSVESQIIVIESLNRFKIFSNICRSAVSGYINEKLKNSSTALKFMQAGIDYFNNRYVISPLRNSRGTRIYGLSNYSFEFGVNSDSVDSFFNVLEKYDGDPIYLLLGREDRMKNSTEEVLQAFDEAMNKNTQS
jgi:hypothetical protein